MNTDAEQQDALGMNTSTEQGWRPYAQRTCRLEASPSRELLDPSVPDANFEKWVDWAHHPTCQIKVRHLPFRVYCSLQGGEESSR